MYFVFCFSFSVLRVRCQENLSLFRDGFLAVSMSHGLGRQHQTTLLLFCFKEQYGREYGRESILKSHMKIKNHVMKAPVKYPSSYKDIFNVQKENIEPVSVK